MFTVLLTHLAVNYGEGSYNTSTYNSAGSAAAAGNSGGTLVNTGIAVAAVVALAATIMLVALAVRIARRKKAAPEV